MPARIAERCVIERWNRKGIKRRCKSDLGAQPSTRWGAAAENCRSQYELSAAGSKETRRGSAMWLKRASRTTCSGGIGITFAVRCEGGDPWRMIPLTSSHACSTRRSGKFFCFPLSRGIKKRVRAITPYSRRPFPMADRISRAGTLVPPEMILHKRGLAFRRPDAGFAPHQGVSTHVAESTRAPGAARVLRARKTIAAHLRVS